MQTNHASRILFKGSAPFLIVALMIGCAAPAPTSAPLPTFSSAGATATSPATVRPTTAPPSPTASAEPDRFWGERDVGGTVSGLFFYRAGSSPCVRYLSSKPGAKPVEACASAGAVVIPLQVTETDSAEQVYTVIAGRLLSDRVSVIVVELERGESQIAELSDMGFFTVLSSQRRPVALVPVDQFGNLVGGRVALR